MSYVFNTIGLIGKFGDPSVADSLGQIATFLRRRDLRMLLDDRVGQADAAARLEVVSRRALGRRYYWRSWSVATVRS
ncbi:MAG: hypothetical protein U1F68_03745 [Gammaproteobacteria bacterium]